MRTKSGATAIAFVSLAVLTAAVAGAATWDGGSPSTNALSDPRNWTFDTAPPNDGTANLEFPNSPRPFPTASPDWDIEGITFTASSMSYNLLGAPIQLGIGGVVNVSTRTQLIANPLYVPAQSFWAAAAGALIFNGPVSPPPSAAFSRSTLRLTGDQNFTFIAPLTDDSGGAFSYLDVSMEGQGVLTLAGVNDCDNIYVESGTLQLDTDSPGTLVWMRDGTVFTCDGTHTVDRSIFGEKTVTYAGSGILTAEALYMPCTDTLIVDTTGRLEVGSNGELCHARIWNGTVVLQSVDSLDTMRGSAEVGDGLGAPMTALLRTTNLRQIDAGTDVLIREDGFLDLQGTGPHLFDAVSFEGGRLTADTIDCDAIIAGPSDAVATIDADLAPPSFGMHVEKGTALVDLDVTGDVLGTGQTIETFGSGRIRFSGGSLGAIAFDVIEEGGLVLATTDPTPGITAIDIGAGGSIEVTNAHQMGAACALTLGSLATATFDADQRIDRLLAIESCIGGSGTLEIVSGDAAFASPSAVTTKVLIPVHLGGTAPIINGGRVLLLDVRADAPLTLRGAEGIHLLVASAPSITSRANLDLKASHLIADLYFSSGVLQPDRGLDPSIEDPQGQLDIDGDFILSGGELLIEIDGDPASMEFDRVAVRDSASMGATLRVVSRAGAAYAEGDRFTILTAGVLNGAFDETLLPDVGPGLSMGVEIDTVNGVVDLVIAPPVAIGEEPVVAAHVPVALAARPNPARGPVDITYSVERPGPVRADVFDVTGRRVATLLERMLSPGQYRIPWAPAATGLPSGVYRVVVRSPGKLEHRAITLLR